MLKMQWMLLMEECLKGENYEFKWQNMTEIQ